MNSTSLSKAKLKKYIKVDGKWRFVPLQKLNGVPYPGRSRSMEFPFVPHEVPSTSSFMRYGRRVQSPVGNSPREAKDAWYRYCSPETQAESDEDEENLGADLISVRAAFDQFPEEVKATREPATCAAYRADLNWVRRKIGKQLVSK